VENGVINTWVIEEEPEVYERVARAAIQKRLAALKEAKKIEEKIGYLPILMLHESEAFARVKATDIMTKNVKTVPADLPISELLQLMAQQHHIGYPVVNENGEPIGIVTLEEASLIEKEKRGITLVSQIIRRKPVWVKPDATALDVYKKMSEFETGRVLVLDDTDSTKILGMVTKSDLMHTLIENSES
jgi:CBS domain-containing protein